MKYSEHTEARKFLVGKKKDITISDCAHIQLDADEQVTFLTSEGKQVDFTAKDWGFYATPSINSRLVSQGFKTALVKNLQNRFFILIVDSTKIEFFLKYIEDEGMILLEWLDER